MRYLLAFALLISLEGFAQCKEYIIGKKGDTLNCVDMKGRKQGRWVVHVDNLRGERGFEEEGVYVNGLKEGIWRRFSLEGDLTAIENYRWGNKDGRNIYLNNLGDPLRQESWKAVNPDNPYDTIDVVDPNDPTRVKMKQVVKLEGYSLKHGTWKYYDPFRGTIEKTEEWFLDKPVTKGSNSDDDELAPIDVSDPAATAKANEKKKAASKPKEVMEFEKKNAGKKKIKARDGQTF